MGFSIIFQLMELLLKNIHMWNRHLQDAAYLKNCYLDHQICIQVLNLIIFSNLLIYIDTLVEQVVEKIVNIIFLKTLSVLFGFYLTSLIEMNQDVDQSKLFMINAKQYDQLMCPAFEQTSIAKWSGSQTVSPEPSLSWFMEPAWDRNNDWDLYEDGSLMWKENLCNVPSDTSWVSPLSPPPPPPDKSRLAQIKAWRRSNVGARGSPETNSLIRFRAQQRTKTPPASHTPEVGEINAALR